MAATFEANRSRILGRRPVILTTIGSLFPFDRLIRMVDDVAAARPELDLFAQIGRGTYVPKNMRFSRILSSKAFADAVKSSRLMIAHAGMGSVIMAMEAKLPIVVVPRRRELGEHTTDHQIATARWLEAKSGIHVVWEDGHLSHTIDIALANGLRGDGIPPAAPAPFLQKIMDFIGQA
jgi:UDP-N-acetylglucosamine transferase subunit ALG13